MLALLALSSLLLPVAWQKRCSVGAGITGTAQALIWSEGVAGKRLKLDLQYGAVTQLGLS